MSKQNRITVLDGVRGVAILMILAFHYINNALMESLETRALTSYEKVALKLTEWGWSGVDLFFVLSGFLIGAILLFNREKNNYFKAFYLRRVYRILPTYFLLIGVFSILKFFFNNPNAYIFEKPFPLIYYFTFTQNIFMGLEGTFGSQGLGPTWSLAIEEQFYLVCPLLIFLLKPKKILYALIIVIIAAPLFRYYSTNWYMSYTWFTSRMDSLAIGVLLAWYKHGTTKGWLPQMSLKSIKFILLGVLLSMALIEFIIGSLGVFKHTFLAFFFAFSVLFLLESQGKIKELLSTKILVHIGLISYPLYLFHNLFNGVAHQVVLNNLKPSLNNSMDYLVTSASLLVSILFSKLVFDILEQPIIKIGKKTPYHKNE